MTHLLPPLLKLAKDELLSARELACQDVQAKVDRLCPPRQVRSFCQVRLQDASTLSNKRLGSKLSHCKRSVQLRIWDISSIDPDTRPKVGERYVVSVCECSS